MATVLFERDPAGVANRLVLTMDDREACWALGIAEALVTALRSHPGDSPENPLPAPLPRGPRPPELRVRSPITEKLPKPGPASTTNLTPTQARELGYEGDPCIDCGQFMLVRNGTCLKCQGCGATSGCS